MGALIPGVLLGIAYIVYVFIAAQLFPKLAPAPKGLEPVDAKLIFDTLLAVLPPILLILAVLGSIFFGIATPDRGVRRRRRRRDDPRHGQPAVLLRPCCGTSATRPR